MTTGKTIALTRWTFVGKVESLLFNMLSRLVITFLLRSKRLLISWLQSPSAVILEPPKTKSLTVPTVSSSVCHELYWVLNQLKESVVNFPFPVPPDTTCSKSIPVIEPWMFFGFLLKCKPRASVESLVDMRQSAPHLVECKIYSSWNLNAHQGDHLRVPSKRWYFEEQHLLALDLNTCLNPFYHLAQKRCSTDIY